jgi:hypothetical protein
LYLSELIPLIEEFKSLIKEFKEDVFESFEEFYLFKTTNYYLKDLPDLIKLNAVWIKREDGYCAKVIDTEEKDGLVYLITQDGKYNLSLALYKGWLHVPDYKLYSLYEREGYELFEEVLLHKFYSIDSLGEFENYVKTGSVKVNDAKVVDVDVKDGAVILTIKKGLKKSTVELYRAIMIDKNLQINQRA